MKQAWNRLGTPDAISWVVALLAGIQLVAGSLAAPFVDVTNRLGEFVGLRLLSVVPMLIVLLLGKFLLDKFAQSQPLPLLTVIVFLVSTISVTVTLNWLLILTGFTTEWTVPRRIAVAIPGVFTIQIISAVLVAYARESSRRNQELALTATELVETRQQANSRIQDRKLELVNSVQREIERSLKHLDANASGNASENLKSLIDDVVRPMSYQLSREVSGHKSAEYNISHPKISWSGILTMAVRGNPAYPAATSLWIGLLLGAFLITGFALNGVVATLVLIAFAFVVLSVTKLLWSRIPAAAPVWVRTVLFSLLIIVFAWGSTPFLAAITGYGFTEFPVRIGWLILCVFMTWTVTLVNTVNSSLRETYVQLSTTIDELKREVIHLNNELRLLQKNLSRVLHGPVQEAISASLARLQSAKPGQNQTQLIADARRRVQDALSLLDKPLETRTDLQRSLADLVELWDEVVHIDISMDVQTRETIEQDVFASYTLIELIREACGNAIRHGEATRIEVSVDISDEGDSVQLTITNNGTPLPPSPSRGFGSQMFDEMCLDWSRNQDGAVVRFEAELPLAS